MPEKWKSAILTPRSKDTKNNLDHQENNEKSTNNKQTNSTSKSNILSSSMISSSAIAATSTNQKNINSKEINNANNGSGTGKNCGIKKPSLKIKNREKLDTTLLRLLALLPNAAEPLDASNLLENSAKNGQKRPKRCSRVGQKTPDYSENH